MRRATVRNGFLALLALLLLVPFVQAAEGRSYVVLVGIDKYQDPAILPRARAEADAKALYDLLTEKEAFPANGDSIKLLLGSKDDGRKSELATRENILRAFRWALNTATPDDLVLLCFVGQGAPIGDRTCYFAVDSSLKDRAKNAVGAAEIAKEMEKVVSTRVCVLLDVNFKGYADSKERISESGLDRRFMEYNGAPEDSEVPPKPISFLSANNAITPSIDLKQQGLFMTVVLEALKGAADNEGGEADGLVTVDELTTYVRKELPLRAQQEASKDQRAFIAGKSTHFPLTRNPTVAGRVKQRLEKLAALSTLSPEVAKEGRELLTQMPRLENQRKLRRNYQQLVDGKLSVDEFLKERLALRDAFKLPREDAVSFAEKVLRVARMARENYVKPVNLNDLVAAAVKGLYRRLDEKLPGEVSDRLAKIKDLKEEDLSGLLADARQQLGNREDLKETKAMDLALDAMLHSLDNYSTFIDQETVDRFRRETMQVFIGVGIQIGPDFKRNMIRVTTPIRGSPAYKAGIKAGDIITKVTNLVDKKGNPLPQPEVTSTKGMELDDAVKKILGKAETPVKLTVEREGVEQPLDFEIIRSRVEVETVIGSRRNDDDSWDYYLDPENKIVYVRLNQFAANTERDLKAVMKDLEKKGVNGLVLDLRFNPGGYLDAAVEISDLFVDDGVIVTIRQRVGRGNEFKGQHAGSLLNFPMVVLVNGGSASASEIVSACIQDQGRGIVMGERSYGKGSVQNIMPLNLGGSEAQVKLTTASFWRPTGKNLNKFPNSKDEDDWGVRPHPDFTVKLEPSEQVALHEHLRNSEVIPRRDAAKMETKPTFVDQQLDKALEYLRSRVTAKAPMKRAG